MLTTTIRALGVALAAAAALPGSAGAVSVTLGQTGFSGSSGGGASGCLTFSGCSFSFSQTAVPQSGTVLVAPTDGVITSWRIVGSAGGDGELRLRVIHPAGGGQFAGAGASAPATALDGVAANATSLPIQAGDYVGVDASAGSSGTALVTVRSVSGASYNRWSPALAGGPAMSPTAAVPDGALELSATVQLTPPVVGTLSRSSGSTEGGQTVTIIGEHLAGATAVQFGSVPAKIVSVSNDQITATTPAAAPGTVDVRVITSAGSSDTSPTDQYTFLPLAAPPPPRDKIAPVLTNYRLSQSTFAAAGQGASIAPATASAARKKPGIGTTARFTLSERAVVSFAVAKRLTGRTVNGVCVKPTKGNRAKRPCTRYIALTGKFTIAGTLGSNSIGLTGRLGGKKLAPGKYRLVATATDAAGNTSQPRHIQFTIVTR
jgi:hypothetical protein